jgi:hypothetical protein
VSLKSPGILLKGLLLKRKTPQREKRNKFEIYIFSKKFKKTKQFERKSQKKKQIKIQKRSKKSGKKTKSKFKKKTPTKKKKKKGMTTNLEIII